MNVLAFDKQKQVLNLILEGTSIRGCSRLTHVHTRTITNLCLEIGRRGAELQNAMMKNLVLKSIEFDELWSYVFKKQKNIPKFSVSNHIGDQYVFVAFAPESKAVLCSYIGKRTDDSAFVFLKDLRDRLACKPQLNSDRFNPYTNLIGKVFGAEVNYGQIVKNYGRDKRIKSVSVASVYGSPQNISTTSVERNNLTLRMGIKRLARKTNAFSKKFENHKAAIDLFIFYYNFCRIHSTLGTTPALKLGVTDHLWSMEDLIRN